MAKKITNAFQESLMSLFKLGLIAVIGGVISIGLVLIINGITNAFNITGELGVLTIATVLTLTLFTFAMSMKKSFKLIDLIPILIASPLVVAILTALGLGTIPVVSSSVEIGASLGLTLVSVVFANNVLRNLKLFN